MEPPLSKRSKSNKLSLEKNKGVVIVEDSDLFTRYWQLKKTYSVSNFQIALNWMRCAPMPTDGNLGKKKKPINIVGTTSHLITQVTFLLSFFLPSFSFLF